MDWYKFMANDVAWFSFWLSVYSETQNYTNIRAKAEKDDEHTAQFFHILPFELEP